MEITGATIAIPSMSNWQNDNFGDNNDDANVQYDLNYRPHGESARVLFGAGNEKMCETEILITNFVENHTNPKYTSNQTRS